MRYLALLIFLIFCITGLALLLIYERQERKHDVSMALEIAQNAVDRCRDAEDLLEGIFGVRFDPEKVVLETVRVTAFSSTRKQCGKYPWTFSGGETVAPARAAASPDLNLEPGTIVFLDGVGAVTICGTTDAGLKKTIDLWFGQDLEAVRRFGKVETTGVWVTR
jgi:3D (Asp-Asp-Asp) domain-containing protein